MRTLIALCVLATTMAFALGTGGVNHLEKHTEARRGALAQSEKARREVLKQLHASFKVHLPGAAKHLMKALQSSGSATCDQQQFQSTAINLVAQCPAIQQAEIAFAGNASNAEMEAICGNGCPATFRSFVADNLNCFGTAAGGRLVLGQVDTLIVACQQQVGAPGGDYCGQQVGNFYKVMACDQIPVQSVCESSQVSCTWDATASTCGIKSDSATITGICTKCIRDMVAQLVQIRPTAASRVMQLTFNELVCKKSGGEFCLVKMATFDSSAAGQAISSSTADKAALNTGYTAVCTDVALMSCYRSFLNFGNRLATETAKLAYDRCINVYASSTASTRRRVCYPGLDAALQSSRRLQNMLAVICHKAAAGDYCIPYATDFGIGLAHPGCQGSAPTEACCTQWSWAITSPGAGCCLHSLLVIITGGDLQYGAAEVPTSFAALPNPPGVTGPPPLSALPDNFYTPVPTNSLSMSTLGTNFANTLGQCTGTDVATVTGHVTNGCVEPRAVANPTLNLKLKIKYAKIASDNALRNRIRAALRGDMASTLNVATTQIVNDTLTADSSVTVNAHHMAALQGASASSTEGTRYTFAVEASTDAEATAASSSFNSAVADDALTVAATEAVVSQECTDCTSSSGGSLAAGGGGSSSNAGKLSALAVAALAIIVTLF